MMVGSLGECFVEVHEAYELHNSLNGKRAGEELFSNGPCDNMVNQPEFRQSPKR